MAKFFTWICILLVALNAVASNTQSPENTLQIDQQLDPVHQTQLTDGGSEADAQNGGDREKRLILLKKIGLKAGLLDFVFGKIDSFIDAKTRYINELDKQNIIKNEKYFGITPPPKVPQPNLKPTGPPPVDFPVNSAVSLVIPDRLYGNSFTLVTNASKILGDVIFNTADRAQELADTVNSKLKNKFGFAKKFLKLGQHSSRPITIISSPGASSSSSSASSSASSSSNSSISLSGSTSFNLLT